VANGAQHEAAALAHLRSAGLTLVARNCRYRVGEIDLVMRDGATLVFVEVRFRSHAGYGGGTGSVDARKQARLVAAASLYLAEHPADAHRVCRFDVVAIDGAGKVDWVRDAFGA
jgi:putative endonuclease